MLLRCFVLQARLLLLFTSCCCKRGRRCFGFLLAFLRADKEEATSKAEHTSAYVSSLEEATSKAEHPSAFRQHTSARWRRQRAKPSIRQHYVSIRHSLEEATSKAEHTSAYVSICQLVGGGNEQSRVVFVLSILTLLVQNVLSLLTLLVQKVQTLTPPGVSTFLRLALF
jgi:hypothetical protein